jgi:hypothetical protein
MWIYGRLVWQILAIMCCDAKLTKWTYLCETFCERLCTKLKLAILGMLEELSLKLLVWEK